ncbi:hypothetical protein AMS68_004980 [Peltaster fructicola]|uniref:Uncharacterized protein n=1 Tax=Peltaster fructicola TaxID=286661 RepID=A0A6H0XXI2_9PEZI|nr:hypothetical protein AMS68_004980 [Peltaster fructicola]
MAHVSAQDEAIDDTGRHMLERESLNHYTNQTSSTYDTLDHAVAAPTISQINYSLATLWDAFESKSTMPGAHAGLKPWPDVHDLPQDGPRQHAFSQPPKQQASVATLRSRYEAAQQPLNVSQQTSASSIRDMALRKGRPSVLRKEDKPGARPLKSALKRYPSEQREAVARPQFLYPPEHEQAQPPAKQPSRFARFGNLFSRRSSSSKSIPSPQVSRTPSTTSAVSTGYAVPTGPRLRELNPHSLRSPIYQTLCARQSSLKATSTRAKINIRRPTKGITNWFDGLEISSDEDDLTPVELPANEALPSTFTMFSPERTSGKESMRPRQKGVNEDRLLTKAERVLGQSRGVERNISQPISHHQDPSYDTEEYVDYRAATPRASQQNRDRGGTSSGFSNSMASSVEPGDTDTDVAGRRSLEDSYNSHLSSIFGHALPNGSQRPQIPPRRLQSAQIASHNAYSSIDRPRLTTRDSYSKHSHRSQRTDDNYDDRLSTSRKSSFRTTSDTPKSRGRGSTRMSSTNGYDDSSGGVSLDAISSDLSHMMAVTEEEMALLEMMRNKRAAMQKDSYSEGYRQALKREHEQLMQRRMVAQRAALRILRSQQEEELVRQQAEYNAYDDGDEKEIRRLNKLKQQEMDRTKRLEKFLAMDTSFAAALDDAGIPQDDLLQDWPLSGQESLRPPGAEARRSRKIGRTPSFSRRDVYDEGKSRMQSDKHGRPEPDSDMALTFPEPPDMRVARHKQAGSREAATNLVRFEPTSSEHVKAQRKSQALYTKSATQDAAYRHELYMMSSHSAARTSKASQPSRQQIQSTTFLRSISDYHPTENNSITSQGSASISASIVSPATPSSTGVAHAGKLSAMDSEDGEYIDHSSPELVFSKPLSNTVALRKTKQLPSALAIVAETSLSSHRNSMASNNSAGEDVLAAWADLGGNEGMLPSRSRRTKRG